MAEREIRYCTTADGVRIAYTAAGQGPVLLYLDVYNTEGAWQPSMQSVERFVTVVRYHPRGLGLSDHDVLDMSLAAHCLDIEAVLTSLGGRPALILNAEIWGTILGLAFAATYPALVDRMALVSARTSIPEEVATRVEELIRVFPDDLRSVFETHMRSFNAWEGEEHVIRAVVRAVCASMSMRQFAALWRAMTAWDARDLIPHVAAPTLLIYTPHWATALSEGREIMSRLQHGRMLVVDGGSDVWRSIVSFFGGDEGTREAVLLRLEQALAQAATVADTAVILFTDIVDSTALTERLGDEAFHAASRAMDVSIRTAMRDADGQPVAGKVLGDGVMGIFSSAARAIAAARRCVAISAERGLPLHVGLHAGDVIRESDTVFGGAVNIASRICAICEPGEILVSQTVRDLARSSAGVIFEDRGEHGFKGLADPQRVYAVRSRD
jgi:class 3 adenylate cyclase